MTPPGWKRLVYGGGKDPKRVVVLETVEDITEVAYCPPGVAISHYDYDEAEEEYRRESEERACAEEVERARSKAASTIDEAAVVEVLFDCWELLAEANDYENLRDRIDEILAPVTAFISTDGEEEEVSCAERRRQREEEEE